MIFPFILFDLFIYCPKEPLFKGTASQKRIILLLEPLGMIYDGKNVETALSNLKMVQNCKIC